MIRLQKYLADCGICSRRKAEEHILRGDVKVNNEVITELGFKVEPKKDKVFFKNEPVVLNKKNIYIILNKPTGCVTTAKEQFSRKTVFDYIDIKERLVPVGRLDYDTSGLLILTNDGELTYKLTHPKHSIKKTYIAKVFGVPKKQELARFREGIVIDGYKTLPAMIKVIKLEGKYSYVQISITEGKNRQVRKMCEAIGHRVIELKRISIDRIKLGDLEEGKYRYMTKEEVKYLKKI